VSGTFFKLVEITWEANEDTHQFMRADVFRQIPLFDSASLVARDQFPLVRVDTNIVDCVNGKPESRSWHRVKDVRATWRLVVIIAM
jgi:hypothetical protein